MRVMLGNALDFTVPQVSPTEDWRIGRFWRWARCWGLLGAMYNRFVMALLGSATSWPRSRRCIAPPSSARCVGLVAWFVPAMVGGGDTLTQAILQTNSAGKPDHDFPGAVSDRPVVLRSRSSGGLFAPIILLGASSGALFAGV